VATAAAARRARAS